MTPNGQQVYSNKPSTMIIADFSIEAASIGTWQNPDLRSNLKNTLYLPMTHKMSSTCGYRRESRTMYLFN